MAVHELKTWPEQYKATDAGTKLFELRKNDRGFAVGDELILREYEPIEQTYTGRSTRVYVTYILETFPGLKRGYVILGIDIGIPF